MSIEAIGRTATIAADASSYSASSLSLATSAQSVSGAVVTDLPKAQAVNAPPVSASLPEDNAQQAQVRAVIVQQIKPSFIKTQVVSTENEDIVFLSVDERTGEVINKFPNNAVLGASAYGQSAASQKPDTSYIERVA